MTFTDIMIYFEFRQTNVARALGITRATVSHWRKKGRIPYGRQCELEALTHGKLKAKKDN